MDGPPGRFFGAHIIAAAFLFSLSVSTYHVLVHEAPVLPTLLGQGAHFALSLLLGVAGYYVLTTVETPAERHVVGVQTGAGYVLTLLAAGGYSLHQHFSPEADVSFDVILFEMSFIGIVGGLAGAVVGLNTIRRRRTITELETTTAELETSRTEIESEKQRFESLFQNALSAVVDLRYTDGEPQIERANDVFEALLDHTSADVEGKNVFRIVPLQNDETEAEVAAHVVANEIYEGVVTVEGADGLRHYKLRVIPYDIDGEYDRAFAMYTDVTELRRTQQELAASVEQLETSNERLEQFAYAASHDLQEPLRMVSSYLQLLESRYADELDEDAEEFIAFAVNGAERMQGMIESLLDYSRVTTRGEPLEPTDSNAVLEGVLTDLGLSIEQNDATVVTDELPTVRADEDQLRQVFQNLVSNALKYSGDDPPQVDVTVERMGERWRFTVSDQGIGIDPEKHERIFRVFETAHTMEKGSDSGIGLALCERILERHDGEIWVNSEAGEGASFHFTLPAVDEETA